MISKKLLNLIIILVVIFVGGIGYFYFSWMKSPFIDDIVFPQPGGCESKPIPGRIIVNFKNGAFLHDKDIETFVASKNLSIEYTDTLHPHSIFGIISKSESQVVNFQFQQEQLRKLFSLPGIIKITRSYWAGATADNINLDVRRNDPATLGTSPRLVVTFTGSEQTIRDSIKNNIAGVNVVEKQYPFTNPKDKESKKFQQIVLQFGYQSMFDALRALTNYKSKINKVLLLKDNEMTIDFFSDLNREDILSLLNTVGIQQSELTNLYNPKFNSVVLKVPVGHENEWSNWLRDTSLVEMARQDSTCILNPE